MYDVGVLSRYQYWYNSESKYVFIGKTYQQVE